MYSKNWLRYLFALSFTFCLLLGSNAGLGQTPTATLTGIVQDATGAVLPDVTVSVRNIAQNTTQSTRTNETGTYVMPALNPGKYSITAELPGFKRFVREDIAVQVNQVARVDIRLD